MMVCKHINGLHIMVGQKYIFAGTHYTHIEKNSRMLYIFKILVFSTSDNNKTSRWSIRWSSKLIYKTNNWNIIENP